LTADTDDLNASTDAQVGLDAAVVVDADDPVDLLLELQAV
jgi:hypothetical protein